MTRSTRSTAYAAIFSLLACLGWTGCVDPKAADTGVTTLYVYDEGSHKVLVWDDVNVIYNLGPGAAAPAPSRTMGGALISGLDKLAWGGLTLNTATNELFLVSESGNVVRIEKASTQNNTTLTQTADIVGFTLGNVSSDRLASSRFAQASADPISGNLYVSETGSNNACRIWVVSGPNNVPSNGQAPAGSYVDDTVAQDTGGTGLSAGPGGTVFAFFTGGISVPDPLGNLNSGARLRMSSGSSFSIGTNVIVGNAALGDSTTTYGTLAYDSTFNRLYLARPIASGNAVLAFTQGQFATGNINQAPAGVLGDSSSALASLRVIAHAGAKDWLAGADVDSTISSTSSGAGLNNLYLWKAPSTGSSSQRTVLGTGVMVRGLALDGSK